MTNELELLDNTTAALESVLSHFGDQMTPADLQQRQAIAAQARKAVNDAKRPSKARNLGEYIEWQETH